MELIMKMGMRFASEVNYVYSSLCPQQQDSSAVAFTHWGEEKGVEGIPYKSPFLRL